MLLVCASYFAFPHAAISSSLRAVLVSLFSMLLVHAVCRRSTRPVLWRLLSAKHQL